MNAAILAAAPQQGGVGLPQMIILLGVLIVALFVLIYVIPKVIIRIIRYIVHEVQKP